MDGIDPRRLRALLAALREAGVTHFASGDLVIRMGPLPAAQPVVPEQAKANDMTAMRSMLTDPILFAHENAAVPYPVGDR